LIVGDEMDVAGESESIAGEEFFGVWTILLWLIRVVVGG
jgi:hypothetical protein